MALIDLRTAPLPTVHRATGVGTTWQGYRLAPGCKVTVTSVGAAGRMAFASNGVPASAEAPADGGAVGSHYETLPQDEPVPVTFKSASGAAPSGTLFVAKNSGTGDFIVRLEAL